MSYQLCGELGSGAFGTVFLAEILTDKKSPSLPHLCAIKVIPSHRTIGLREVQFLKVLSLENPNQNVVAFLNHFETDLDEGHYLHQLVLEYVPSTLSSFIKRNKLILTSHDLERIKSITMQIFSGLSHIHKLNVCHR